MQPEGRPDSQSRPLPTQVQVSQEHRKHGSGLRPQDPTGRQLCKPGSGEDT